MRALPAAALKQAPPTRIGTGSLPERADQKLARAQIQCRRWLDAAETDRPGPLWQLLSAFVGDALSGELRHHAFISRVKYGLLLLRYLREKHVPESRVFDPTVARDYKRYLGALRKERVRPPSPKDKPRGRPLRREAQGNEERLDPDTQKLYCLVIRAFWNYALENDAEGFDPLSTGDPTAGLTWRRSHRRPRSAVAFTFEALDETPFVPASGRSRFEHERDVTSATVYASVTTRNTEVREATWRTAQVWEVVPGRTEPLRTWPIEAAVSGEVVLDDERFVLFITVGDVDGTKSHEHRRIPLVGIARERFIRYAQLWVGHQLDTVRYLRCRSRRGLPEDLRSQSLEVAGLELLIGGEKLSVRELRKSVELWRRAKELAGVGHLRVAGRGAVRLEPAEAEAIRTLLWCEIAAERYREALEAFQHGTHVRDIFDGVLFPSREGSVLSVDQQQKSWRDHGWTAKGWTPQRLRQHTVHAFERERLRALRPLGPVAGHREPGTTLDHYAIDEPWSMVQVSRIIQDGIARTEDEGVRASSADREGAGPPRFRRVGAASAKRTLRRAVNAA